jgi:hypothetical protein
MGHYRHVSCDGKKENLQIHYSPYPLMYFLNFFNELNTIPHEQTTYQLYCNLSLLFFCNINGTQLLSLPSLL